MTHEQGESSKKSSVNALCHRDCTIDTSVQVNVFKDFVEIASLGLFPEGDSPGRRLSGGAFRFEQSELNTTDCRYRQNISRNSHRIPYILAVIGKNTTILAKISVQILPIAKQNGRLAWTT